MSLSRNFAVVASLALAVACQSSGNQSTSEAALDAVKAEIRAAADAAISGFNQGDATPYLDQLTDVQIYAENLMIYPSPDSLRSAINQFMASGMSVKMEWTGEPQVIALGADLGVFSSTLRETLTDSAGDASVIEGAWTGVYKRIDGSWKIVAAHESTGAVDG